MIRSLRNPPTESGSAPIPDDPLAGLDKPSIGDIISAAKPRELPEANPAERAKLADSLTFVQAHPEIFDAADAAKPTDHQFARNEMQFIASLSIDSPEWTQIEQGAGRATPYTMEERQAAIDAAKCIDQNWSGMVAHAADFSPYRDPADQNAPPVPIVTMGDSIVFNSDGLQAGLNFQGLDKLFGASTESPNLVDLGSPSGLGLDIPDNNLQQAMSGALRTLASNVDLFEAAEQIDFPDGDPNNGWFANAGVLKVASLTPESPDWEQIESTTGKTYSPEERQAAISAAGTLSQNWDALYAAAPSLGLESRVEGGLKVVDFKTEALGRLNAMLSLPAEMSPALGTLAGNVDLFEAAEQIAFPDSEPRNGRFAGGGVWEVASLTPESPEWAQIESVTGKTYTLVARQAAINAAQTVQRNWDALYEAAPAPGLENRIADGLKQIDFKVDALARLNIARVDAAFSDGTVDPFNQGGVGNCVLLATISSMASTPQGAQILRDSVTDNQDGSFTVIFKGDPDHPIVVNELDLTLIKHSSGDKDVQILEVALEKYCRETGWNGGTTQLGAQRGGYLPLLAGGSHCDLPSTEILAWASAHPGGFVAMFGASHKGSSTGFAPNGTDGSWHAWAVVGCDAVASTITVANPWDAGNPITMDIDQFCAIVPFITALDA